MISYHHTYFYLLLPASQGWQGQVLERHVAAPLRRVCRVLCSRLQVCIVYCGAPQPEMWRPTRVK